VHKIKGINFFDKSKKIEKTLSKNEKICYNEVRY